MARLVKVGLCVAWLSALQACGASDNAVDAARQSATSDGGGGAPGGDAGPADAMDAGAERGGGSSDGGTTADADGADGGANDAGLPGGEGDSGADAAPVRVEVAVPSMIAADCSVDVTAELQAVLDALEPGSTLLFPPGGCFLVQRMLTLQDRKDITIEGHGSTLKRTQLTPVELRYPRHNGHLRFERVAGLRVRGLRVEGTNTGDPSQSAFEDSRGASRAVECMRQEFGCYSVAMAFEHAYALLDCSDARIESSSADAVWGDGVYIDGGADIAVVDVELDRNGRQGIAIVDGERILVDRVRILHSRRGGIDLEPNNADHRVEGVEIRDSQIRSHLLAFPALGEGEVSDVYIHDNTVELSGTPWVWSRGSEALPRSGWRIEANVVLSPLGSPHPGIRLEHTRQVEVRRNSVPFASGRDMVGVGALLDSEAVVECNHFPAATLPASADATSTTSEANNAVEATPPTCLQNVER